MSGGASGRREALVCGGLLLAVVAAAWVPFLVLAPHGVWHSFWVQASRPLQIESLGAALLLAAHHTFGLGLTMDSSHGSQNLAGAGPDTLAVVLSLLQLAALLATWILFARGPATRERLLLASAAALVAFVAFGKVLSPQFLIWLIPVVPLVYGRRGLTASLLLAAALVVTQLWFPYRYWDLALHFGALESWLVLIRDLVLVALFVVPGARPSRRETRKVSQLVARPEPSHSSSAPSSRTPPSAVSNRTGIPVRMRWIASSAFTPITESCGPVMPASVSAAVPPG